MNTYSLTSKNIGFSIFLHEGNRVDEVLGEGVAATKVESIIMREEIMPIVPADTYTVPDWQFLKDSVAKKYPLIAEGIIDRLRMRYEKR